MFANTRPYRSSVSPPAEDDPRCWTLALAGGEGVRLGAYVEQRFGRRIPKQYCCLLGDRSMLQHTLARLNRLAPPARTLTVIGPDHAGFAMPQLVGLCDHVLRQPASRDTGLALYVALAMIKRWSPEAVVTITPTDHYVAPAGKYVARIRQACGVAARLRDRVLLLGVRPTEPDPDLGYLIVDGRDPEHALRGLVGFVEKPHVDTCVSLIGEGALWNTMVTCGTVEALWELGRDSEPQLLDVLDSFVPLIGTPDEDDALEYIYRAFLPVSFSRDILERSPHRLWAIELSGVEWSDWGRPERIESVLRRVRTPRHRVPEDTASLPT